MLIDTSHINLVLGPDFCFREVSPFKVGALELCPAKVGVLELCDAQVGALDALDAALKANTSLAFAWRPRRDALERRLTACRDRLAGAGRRLNERAARLGGALSGPS